jgi:hypothetical protein
MKLLLKTNFKQTSKTVQRWTGFAIISLMTLGLVQLTILFPLMKKNILFLTLLVAIIC